MSRISPLYESFDHSLVSKEITRLSDLYRKEFKRILPDDLLYFASWGGDGRKGNRAHYGISLMWDGSSTTEVTAAKWIQKNVGVSSVE